MNKLNPKRGSTMTPTEKLLAKLCQRTFLSMWSHPTPVRADNHKELCDLLVVNEPYVLIFSVKAVEIDAKTNFAVAVDRWMRRAIEASARQLYGAERAIAMGVGLLSADNKGHAIWIAHPNECRVFRIAVAIGRGERFPLRYGDLGKGFVHTFDEVSLPIVLGELDTISDFTEYLTAKESCFQKGQRLISDSEENMLALYLHQGRKFPQSHDVLVVEPEVWAKFVQKEEVARKKKDDAESYVWDKMMDECYRDHRDGVLYHGEGFEDMEYALRLMSKETRFARRVLSHEFLDFIGFYGNPTAKSRILSSPANVTYVYLLGPHDDSDRETRIKELYLRCFVARSIIKEQPIVIGIATNLYTKGAGHSYDLYCLEMLDWTDENERAANRIKEDLGYFRQVAKKTTGYDEYPTAKAT